MRARLDFRGPLVLGAPALLVTALSLVALLAIRCDVLPWLRGPAPYPPEWQWAYRPIAIARLTPAVLVACVLLAGVAASASCWARDRPRPAARWLLVAASLGGVAFQLALLQREPQGALRALMAHAVSPSISSYHTVAVSEDARDPLAFLRAHARLLPQLTQGRKHAATHPPGPVLWYRGALALCERSPALTEALLAVAGGERRDSQSTQGRAIRAAALVGALGLGLLGVLTLWPLASLAEALGLTPLPAARLATLWVLLPGPALVTPALDATVALAVTGCTVLLVRAACAASWRRGVVSATLAGVCGGLGVFTSYGAVTFLALAALTVIAVSSSERPQLVRAIGAAALAGACTALVAFGVPAFLGHEPLVALKTALEVHHALFTAPRSYALWLVFNPLDFVLFLGLPVAIVGLWALRRSLARLLSRAPLDAFDRFRLAFTAGLLALLLLGVTRGEVGRLWIPLMPLALVATLAEAREGPSAAKAAGIGALVGALTLAIASCWVV
jgi:hypothetical protein